MKNGFLISLMFLAMSARAESGIYWVPVNSHAETQFAVFPLPEVTVKHVRNRVTIKYLLPTELTGAPNMIELSGRAGTGPLILNGHNAFGECAAQDDLSSCKINYKNLNLDVVRRSELLKQISRTPTELELREKVAASFCNVGGEPCGFLRVISP